MKTNVKVTLIKSPYLHLQFEDIIENKLYLNHLIFIFSLKTSVKTNVKQSMTYVTSWSSLVRYQGRQALSLSRFSSHFTTRKYREYRFGLIGEFMINKFGGKANFIILVSKIYHNFFTTSNWNPPYSLMSAGEKLALCDVTNLPYMDIDWQSISIYGHFVTSLTVYYSCADINTMLNCIYVYIT